MPDVEQLLSAIDRAPCLCADLPPVQAILKQSPEDFRVDELPAYEPSGEGEHLFVHIEKTDLNTPDAARALAEAAGLDPRSVSWAGLKDRQAVTTQWLSIHTPQALPDTLDVPGVRVLAQSRHGNKLRTGHLRGNRFRLVLRGLPDAQDGALEQNLQRLRERGVPNYFGSQRFGHGGRNLQQAFRWLVEGGRRPKSPFQRKLQVSTWQSALFNLWLAERLRTERFDRCIPGDLLRKEDTGGMFLCEDPNADDPRCQALEVSATGPLFGARMRWPEGESRQFEEQILTQGGLDEAALSGFKKYGEGGRRPLRVQLGEPSWRREGPDVVLELSLPKGSYATCVVRELTKSGLITTD